MQKARTNGSRHGLTALKAGISARGMAEVDGRTRAMRAVAAWKADLVRDLGGDLSAQRLTLVDLAAKNMLYLNHIDSFLMQQDSLVNKRKRAVLPLLRDRQALADSLLRLLGQLGLDRVERDGGRLPEWMVEKVMPRNEEVEQEQQVPTANGTAPEGQEAAR